MGKDTRKLSAAPPEQDQISEISKTNTPKGETPKSQNGTSQELNTCHSMAEIIRTPRKFHEHDTKEHHINTLRHEAAPGAVPCQCPSYMIFFNTGRGARRKSIQWIYRSQMSCGCSRAKLRFHLRTQDKDEMQIQGVKRLNNGRKLAQP